MNTGQRRSIQLIFVALSALPPLAILRIILIYGHRIPWMDQWGIPGKIIISHLQGKPVLSDFFRPHNESVKAFSGLIWFVLAQSGWDARKEMVLTWLIMVSTTILLFILLRKTLEDSSISRYAVFALIAVFLFNPYGIKHWLTGLFLENALVLLFLTAGILVNRSSASIRLKYCIAAIFSFLATYSYANGMLLWLLLCPSLPFIGSTPEESQPRRKRLLPLLLYGVAGVVSLTVYFSVLAGAPYKKSTPGLDFSDPTATVVFLLNFFGAPFQIPGVENTAPIVAIGLLLLIGLSAVLFFRRSDSSTRNAAYRPWLQLTLYALVTGTIVALGRQQISDHAAFAPRYFIHAVILPIAAFPLAALTIRNLRTSNPRQRMFRTAHLALACMMASICLISVAFQWADTDRTAEEVLAKRLRGTMALSFINLIPDNIDLKLLNPHVVKMNDRTRVLMRYGMLDLTLHKSIPIGSHRPPEEKIPDLQLQLVEDGSIFVSGLVPSQDSTPRITHLLLTSTSEDQKERAFAVICPELDEKKRLVTAAGDQVIRFATRVSVHGLEQGIHQVRAWAYDAHTGKYTPLPIKRLMLMDESGLFFFPRADVTGTDGEAEKLAYDKSAATIMHLEGEALISQCSQFNEITVKDGFLVTEGRDPHVLLPPARIPAGCRAVVKLGLTAPRTTPIQLFYTSDTCPTFSEHCSIWTRVVEGENDLYFAVPGSETGILLRLDLGNENGVFKFKEHSIRLINQ